jgi:hypothetical protein
LGGIEIGDIGGKGDYVMGKRFQIGDAVRFS